MSVFTTKERFELVTAFIKGMSSREISQNFAAAYPDRPIPSKTIIIKWYNAFRITGCLNLGHKKRKRNSNVVTEDLTMNLCLAVEEEDTTTLSNLAEEFHASRSSCFKALKIEKFKSYRIKNVQKLLPRDYFPRMEFCEFWMEKINEDRNILNKILFSDESSFTLNGKINKQNRRVWARENPYRRQEKHTQYRQKVNVWVGIIGNNLVGPFFIDGNLNQQKYLDLLQMEVGPQLDALRGSGEIIFQHDGAPAHSAANVREFLNDTFPDSWIGQHGPFSWTARSPDLTPLDFFLWGHLGTQVYDLIRGQPETVEELRGRITDACNSITVRQLQNTRRNFQDRLGHCLAVEGKQFEQFL
jgi:transposase